MLKTLTVTNEHFDSLGPEVSPLDLPFAHLCRRPSFQVLSSVMNAKAFFPNVSIGQKHKLVSFLENISFVRFYTLPWSIFVCWFTILLIFSFIPDRTFLELTTNFQDERTQLWMRRNQKYQEEEEEGQWKGKYRLDGSLRPQWLICVYWSCEEGQERKGKSLVKYSNLALEVLTIHCQT